MSLTRPALSTRDTLWIAALAVGLPLLAMSLLGVDANWDLRNYHLYNPHAWLTGRAAIDIAPAQVQTWHNPLLDVPMYLLVHSGLHPRLASVWLTMPIIVAMFCLLRLQRLLGPEAPTRVSQLILVLLAMTGAATYSTFANSMNDSFVAAAILGGLVLVLDDADTTVARRWLLAGFLAGCIAGLKLTAAIYCIGLAACALVGGDWKQRLLRTSSLAAGGVTGFLLSYGYWGWRLFTSFGNPFFPYFNNIFHSPYALAQSWSDTRFRPHTVADALLGPIHLLTKSQRFSELFIRDPRLLIGLLGFTALCVYYWKRQPALRNRIATLLVFFLASFLLWVFQFGIYRYAETLELLGCLALVLLVGCLPRARNSALLLAALLVSADTKRPDWGRVKVSAPDAGIVAPSIAADSIVIIAGDEPLAYLALGLPPSVPMIGVLNNMQNPDRCTLLQIRADETIARHKGPIWLLSEGDRGREGRLELMATHYGLRQAGACMPFTSALAAAQLCPQERIVPTPKRLSCTLLRRF